MPELLLGIDIGTYSAKGVLVTPQGEVLKQHVVEHELLVPRPGWAEHDPELVWWQGLTAICSELLSGKWTGADIAGVAVSAIGPCLLPLDSRARPLRNGILYGVDTRASEQIAELESEIGTDRLLEHSGMALTSQAIGPKIRWLRQNEPDVWRQTAHLTTASGFLVHRLTGEHVMDRHTASHYMPLIDISTLEWSEQFEHLVAPLQLLPRLGWSDEIAGTVTREAAALTGLRAGTPVAVGAVDALSEALSVGVRKPGELMIMYGSTTFFILVLDGPVRDERVWLTAGAFPGQYALAAGMATTGSLTRWFRDQLASDLPATEAYSRLFAGAAAVPAGSDGLLTLPYFSGERTPINDPDARGVIAGLNLTHTRDHLFRSVLEGVGFGIRHNLDTFRSLGARIDSITAVGGGTRGGTWPQIVSDISGVSQRLPRQTIGASYGDAMLAGLACGLLDHSAIDDWVGTPTLVEPDPDNQATFDAIYPDFLKLYQSTAPTVHRLAKRSASRKGGDRTEAG